MRTRPVMARMVLFVSCLSLMPAPAQAQSFEDWQKKDKEAFRDFQQGPQPTPPATAKTNASATAKPAPPATAETNAPAARTGPSRPLRTLPERAPSPAPPGGSADTNAIPDGDEMAPVVLPAGTVTNVAKDAGWGCHLSKDPGKLLDALEGGRPGGDVSAMMALLRQTQGPFTEVEDQAMMKKYAPYAASGSAKAHKAIRQHNELLLRSMMHRLMMTQAAWEYDFALAQAEVARRMQDTEELEVAQQLAENQRQVIQEQQTALEAVTNECAKIEPIPTPEELKAEEAAERTNAITALQLPVSNLPEKVLVGYLKFEGIQCAKAKDQSLTPLTPSDQTAVEVSERGASFSESDKVGMGYLPGTTQVNWDTIVKKYHCSWSIPEVIPLYGEKRSNIGGTGEYISTDGPTEVPLKVDVTDAGSKPHRAQKNVALVVGVGTYGSETGGPKPDFGAAEGLTYSTHLIVYVGEQPAKVDYEYAVWGRGTYVEGGNLKSYKFYTPKGKTRYVYFCIKDQCNWGAWSVYLRYKWSPTDLQDPASASPADPNLTAEKNEAIAEHRANITAAEKFLGKVLDEMAAEQDPIRREELRLQGLHFKQDIHDSQDLIESIRTGTIVKTRGPWDEHSAVVLVETSRKLRESCLRAQQMQATYVRMLKKLEKLKPDEAKKHWDSMPNQVIRGIYDPGGFEKAEKAIDQLYGSTMGAMKEAQQEQYDDQAKVYANLASQERNLRYLENLKWSCRMAVAGYTTFGMALAPGLGCGMAYEAACTRGEGPEAAVMNAAIRGGIMLGAVGALKVGSWGISKLLNPKVVESEINTYRNMLELNRYEQEAKGGRALVDQLKRKVAAFNDAKAAGGADYLRSRAELDEAVVAVNGSALGKRFMKNELTVLENQVKTSWGASADELAQMYDKLRECNKYQTVFENRLQRNIYPRAQTEMISRLRSQGYKAVDGTPVDGKWFQEYRNSSSHGVNADLDLGLTAEIESKITKKGQPVSLREFMEDGGKAYKKGYRQVTGQSATLADHNITTSAHSEAFPLSWLQKKVEGGTHATLEAPVTPADFEKAGKAIYNKVKKALAGPDPAFVNLKKACASLGKDINTKVIPRLTNPPASTTVSAESRQLALNHWQKVQKVMDDFASDKCGPLDTMRKLREVTGSTSVTESAELVGRLLKRLGAKP